MKRTRLHRKTPLRGKLETARAWERRSQKKLERKARLRKRGRKYHRNRKKNFGERGPKVEAMRCCNCGSRPSEPHHEPPVSRGGDKHCLVPLCADCHRLGPDSRHRLGSAEKFRQVHGTDLVGVARRVDEELSASEMCL